MPASRIGKFLAITCLAPKFVEQEPEAMLSAFPPLPCLGDSKSLVALPILLAEDAMKPLVLVVDDNSLLRRIAERNLARYAVDVRFAENGKQAVAATQSCYFDLIFMDVSMPEMDGIEATRRIRGNGCPSIILGVTAGGDRRACLDAGMDDCYIKPADYAMLFDRWLPRASNCAERAPDYTEPGINKIELPDGRTISKESPTEDLIEIAQQFDAQALDLTVEQVEWLCCWLSERSSESDTDLKQWLSPGQARLDN